MEGVAALAMPQRQCCGVPCKIQLTLPPALQGSTVLWHPQWLEFPELAVRCDVVIKGPRLDDALGLLADTLTSDLQELEAVPVYFVEGLRFVEPLGESHHHASTVSGTFGCGFGRRRGRHIVVEGVGVECMHGEGGGAAQLVAG